MKKTAANKSRKGNGSILMLSMLMVAVFFSMAARAIFSPIMPSLQSDLGLSLAAAGSLFLYISVSYAVAILLAGFLTARIGHGLTIVVSLALIAIGLLISALAPGVALIAVGMIFIGAGAGLYPPSGIAMVNRKISPPKRTIAFAFHEISPNFALLLSPLMVLAAQPFIGWRGVLLVMSAICGIATLAFWRWGSTDSGVGAAPNFSTIGIILKMRGTYVGMIVLSAAAAGLHGVYAILPAYLVDQSTHSIQEVNSLLVASRLASILFLLFAGVLVNLIGKRNTINWALIFTCVCTAMIGFLQGTMLDIVIIAQPALVAAMIPPLLSSVAEIGESSYQNITYGLIITVGISVGAGIVPAVLGIFGDLGLGWLGFVCLGGFMMTAVVSVLLAPDFGKE
jgi:predicted MFS family arabinose efflux permease